MTENNPIDPDQAAEAVQQVDEAMAILPKRRLGCRGRLAKCCAVLLLLLVVFVYWNFLRTPRLRISRQTTYITEPLTADGKRVDYFAALEQDLYPPQMKTDDNGYRMIVRELGNVEERFLLDSQGNTKIDTEDYTAQVYEKLGLDATSGPTLACVDPYDFLREYGGKEGLDEKQILELFDRGQRPWTLDDLPMMAAWLEQNGPAIDLVAQAVKKRTFCIPLIRPYEDATLVDSPYFPGAQGTRSFARMLLARANYRIGVGDIDGAIDDVLTCERLGRHLARRATIISRLVGIAIEGMAASIGVAAVRESQPTQEQLRRFVAERNAIPPRLNMDRMWLTGRYGTLDWLHAMADGEKSFDEVFSSWEAIKVPTPRIAASLPVDWNIVLRRTNAHYDNLDETEEWYPPKRLLLGNLFIGARSRHLGDFLACLYMPSSDAIREANRRSTCVDNLHRITLAMLLYEHEHGTLPPAYTVDADGNPLHSWRVLLLPYLGRQELHDKIRLDEPWDSRHNRQFHDADVAIYQCPSAMLKPGESTYSVVVGANAPFQAGEGKSLDDFGMNLILVVEREEEGVCWMDPTSELTEAVARKGINRQSPDGDRIGDGIGSQHPGGVNVGLRNGSARFIAETIDPKVLEGLLDGTAEGGSY